MGGGVGDIGSVNRTSIELHTRAINTVGTDKKFGQSGTYFFYPKLSKTEKEAKPNKTFGGAEESGSESERKRENNKVKTVNSETIKLGPKNEKNFHRAEKEF